jgi:hypothetical protein
VKFLPRFTAGVVIGVEKFGAEPVGELAIRFDFQLEEEHVALKSRSVARRARSAHAVINEPPSQVRRIHVAAELLVVLFGHEQLPPKTT